MVMEINSNAGGKSIKKNNSQLLGTESQYGLPPRPIPQRGDYNLMLSSIGTLVENRDPKARVSQKKLNLNRNIQSDKIPDNSKYHVPRSEFKQITNEIKMLKLDYQAFVDLQKVFLNADTDRDGLISIKEFIQSIYKFQYKYSRP